MKTTLIAILALAYASSDYEDFSMSPMVIEYWKTHYKIQCNQVNYIILSAGNPYDYPAISMDIDNISQNGADCIMTEFGEPDTILDCDCSDAENYNFEDEDVCEDFEKGFEKHTDKLKSLTCGPDYISPEDIPEDTKKAMCNHANYIIQSVMRRKPDYPEIPDSPDSVQQYGYDEMSRECTIWGDSGDYEETFYDCDCMNDNYDFFDQGLCDMMKNQSAPEDEKYVEGLVKMKNLTCGEVMPGTDMENKRECSIINYEILSAANPTEYPAISPKFGDTNNFVQDGTKCNAGDKSVADCDCSDAENYSFADQELCDEMTLSDEETILFELFVPESVHQGTDKLLSLVCGNDVSVNSISMILFTMLAILKY